MAGEIGLRLEISLRLVELRIVGLRLGEGRLRLGDHILGLGGVRLKDGKARELKVSVALRPILVELSDILVDHAGLRIVRLGGLFGGEGGPAEEGAEHQCRSDRCTTSHSSISV